MSYTTVTNVAGMFPAFQRGTPQQKPADALIQQYIDDVAGDTDAILQRRYGEMINQQYGGSFTAFQAAFSSDAQNVLEKINRYGAAAQLGQTLATFGAASAERLANDFQSAFLNLMSELRATDEKGSSGGIYDHLFDPQSATPSPRPGLRGVAGGDRPRDQTPRDTDMSNFFGKFDRR
ncbi:MAG: hypothetical protein ACRD1I_00055 [Terriglobia bacterium]